MVTDRQTVVITDKCHSWIHHAVPVKSDHLPTTSLPCCRRPAWSTELGYNIRCSSHDQRLRSSS